MMNVSRHEAERPMPYEDAQTHRDTRAPEIHRVDKSTRLDPIHVASMAPFPFPLGNFTCYFTLSPECFSPFLHSTCLLSVSVQYLALDGVYHPIGAAISSNPTLGTEKHNRNG